MTNTANTEHAYRAIRAISERGGVDDLAALAEIRDELEAQIAYVIAQQREKFTPWETIGRTLGVTRQAAQQRYGS